MVNRIITPMWDKMQVFCKHISDHQIRLILNFDNQLNKDILKNAAIITLKNNPIAYASYFEDKKDSFWRFNELDIEKIFFYHECQDTDLMVQETILKRLDTLNGPQIEISLIRGKQDFLIINCDHSITDAAGVKDFAYQLAENHSKIAQNENIIEFNYLPKRSLKVLSNKLNLKAKWLVLKLTLLNKRNVSTFQINQELTDVQHSGYKSIIITPSDFIRIKKFGKQYTATINDMLLAIYFYTLQKVSANSNKTNRLTFSADLRVFMDADDYDTFSNFSTIHNIDINNTSNDFHNLLKGIASTTKIKKQFKYNLADFPMMAMLFKTMPYNKLKGVFHKEFDKIKKSEKYAPPGLTNTGVIDETKIAFDMQIPAQAYIRGTINHPSLLIVTASTYKKHLTLSVGSYCAENNTFISTFLKEFQKTIHEKVLSF